MHEYRVIYGGLVSVQADTPEQAYRQFWSIIQARCEEGQLGLITHIDGEPTGLVKDGLPIVEADA